MKRYRFKIDTPWGKKGDMVYKQDNEGRFFVEDKTTAIREEHNDAIPIQNV